MVTSTDRPADPKGSDTETSAGEDPGNTRLRHSLPVRVAMLLGLALLPIGLIALVQSWRAIEVSEDVMEASLLARTAELVAPERAAIYIEIGRARALADTLAATDPNPARCVDIMRRAVNSSERLLFAGFFTAPGISNCNNTGVEKEMPVIPAARQAFASQEPLVTFTAVGGVTGEPVIIVSEPVRAADGTFLGFVSSSFKVEQLEGLQGPGGDLSGAIITFNHLGHRLTYTNTDEDSEEAMAGYLPRDYALSELVEMGSASFVATDLAGRRRHFALVPIVNTQAYALGSWPVVGLAGESSWALRLSALLFPVLMWVISIAVAVAAVNRLVLRHIRDLGRRMRSFADTRRVFQSREIESAPTELRDINSTFDAMVQKILRDEAELEDAIYERGMLMKEVHHRVKNNLQQISSIINMQIRETRSEEAKQALGEFRNRVMGLASIYRALYQEPSVASVRMDILLDQLLSQLVTAGSSAQSPMRIEQDLAQVRLPPDQASPLAMLATESLVYAFGHRQPTDGEAMHLSVRLYQEAPTSEEAPGQICLVVTNNAPRDTEPRSEAETAKSLLGERLIEAFAQQLNTQGRFLSDDEKLVVKVCFDPEST